MISYDDYIKTNPEVILPIWDEALRYQYPLDSNSLVVDVGGYVGDFADLLHKKYGCKMAVFEPMPDSFSKLHERFSSNSAIQYFNYGLAGSDRYLEVDNAHDATSLVSEGKGGNRLKVLLRSFKTVMDELRIKEIDLLKINIEGGEYELLPHIIESGFMPRIKHIQIQYHIFIPNAKKQRLAIKTDMHKTHNMKWDKPFVWESWDLR